MKYFGYQWFELSLSAVDLIVENKKIKAVDI